MKIAMAAPSQIPARRANTLQVMKMAQALQRCGYEVCLASPQSPGSPKDIPWTELVHLYGLGSAAGPGSSESLPGMAQFEMAWLLAHPAYRRYDYGLRVLRWARRVQADLLYTRLPQAAALASLVGLPVILEAHDLPQGMLGPLVWRLFLAGRGRRRLVAITRALADALSQRLGAPPAAAPETGAFTIVAPDAVDVERYANLPGPAAAREGLGLAGLPVERFTAGYSGHLYPGKGSQMLLSLAAALPQISFLVVGGEPGDVESVRQDAQRQGLANLILTGFVANADLPRYQAACDVLLAPYERQVAGSSGGNIAAYFSPLKLFEYLACGRAIFCSDLPVLREVLDESYAWLLPPGDVAAWVAALQALSQDAARCRDLGQQARQQAQQHTWEQRARRILAGLPEAAG